ncbi:unnamed protein product [Brugia timori]|uniref:Ovule protein n=1 Tax=Brugia timori TaxID=42155 RepID=A0A0R3RBQ4_9BILA|nr:unnamed protein product [Brugia timori]
MHCIRPTLSLKFESLAHHVVASGSNIMSTKSKSHPAQHTLSCPRLQNLRNCKHPFFRCTSQHH